MRPLQSMLASLVVAGVALPAVTSAMTPAQPAFDVRIFDRTEGRVLPSYRFEGRMYVVGKPGNEYSITLANRSGERMMAVTSVDGVNVVTGETASPMQSGYVLSPWQDADIKGWRKSLANVAAFYFTDHGDSYAARTGRPNDIGVIGVALFRERRAISSVAPSPPVTPYGSSDRTPYGSSTAEPMQRGRERDAASDAATSPGAATPPPLAQLAQPGAGSSSSASANAAPSMESSARREKSLGTGHGRIESASTRYTEFERASSRPDEVLTIYYDTYNNLLAMGVPVWRDSYDDRYSRRDPHPFPRDPTLGFVPDPGPRAPRAPGY